VVHIGVKRAVEHTPRRLDGGAAGLAAQLVHGGLSFAPDSVPRARHQRVGVALRLLHKQLALGNGGRVSRLDDAQRLSAGARELLLNLALGFLGVTDILLGRPQPRFDALAALPQDFPDRPRRQTP